MTILLGKSPIGIAIVSDKGGTTNINNQDRYITENGVYTADEGYTGLGTVEVNVESSLLQDSRYAHIYIGESGNFDYYIQPNSYLNVAKYYARYAPVIGFGASGIENALYELGTNYYVRSSGAFGIQNFADVNNMDYPQMIMQFAITQLPHSGETYTSLYGTSAGITLRHDLRIKYNADEDTVYFQLVLIDRSTSPLTETICLEVPLYNASQYLNMWMNVALIKQNGAWAMYGGLKFAENVYTENLQLATAGNSIFMCNRYGDNNNMTDETGYFQFALDMENTGISGIWSAVTPFDAMRQAHVNLNVDIPAAQRLWAMNATGHELTRGNKVWVNGDMMYDFNMENITEETLTGYVEYNCIPEEWTNVIVPAPIRQEGGEGGEGGGGIIFEDPSSNPLDQGTAEDGYINLSDLEGVGTVFYNDRGESTATNQALLTDDSNGHDYINNFFASEDKSMADEFVTRFYLTPQNNGAMSYVYMFGQNSASDGGDYWDGTDRRNQFRLVMGTTEEQTTLCAISTGYTNEETGETWATDVVNLYNELPFGWNTIRLYFNDKTNHWHLAYGANLEYEQEIYDLPAIITPYNMREFLTSAGVSSNSVDLSATGFRKDGEWVWRPYMGEYNGDGTDNNGGDVNEPEIPENPEDVEIDGNIVPFGDVTVTTNENGINSVVTGFANDGCYFESTNTEGLNFGNIESNNADTLQIKFKLTKEYLFDVPHGGIRLFNSAYTYPYLMLNYRTGLNGEENWIVMQLYNQSGDAIAQLSADAYVENEWNIIEMKMQDGYWQLFNTNNSLIDVTSTYNADIQDNMDKNLVFAEPYRFAYNNHNDEWRGLYIDCLETGFKKDGEWTWKAAFISEDEDDEVQGEVIKPEKPVRPSMNLTEGNWDDSLFKTGEISDIGTIYLSENKQPVVTNTLTLNEKTTMLDYADSLFTSDEKVLVDEFAFKFFITDSINTENDFVYLFGQTGYGATDGDYWDGTDRTDNFNLAMGYSQETSQKQMEFTVGGMNEGGETYPLSISTFYDEINFGWNDARMYWNGESWCLDVNGNSYSLTSLPKSCKPYNVYMLVSSAFHGQNTIDLSETGFKKDGEWVWRIVENI